jgi:hypothetical protein
VYEVAKAHARYLGYEVCDAFMWTACTPPPGDLEAMGPVVRLSLCMRRRSGKHCKPTREALYIDVERRAGGRFHLKTATIEPV